MKGSGENRKVCALGWRKGNGDVVRVFLSIECRVLPSLLRSASSLQKPTLLEFCVFNLTYCSSTYRWWFSPYPQPSRSCWASLLRACKKRNLFPKCNYNRSVGGRTGPLSILRHSVCLDFVTCPPHFEHCQS